MIGLFQNCYMKRVKKAGSFLLDLMVHDGTLRNYTEIYDGLQVIFPGRMMLNDKHYKACSLLINSAI